MLNLRNIYNIFLRILVVIKMVLKVSNYYKLSYKNIEDCLKEKKVINQTVKKLWRNHFTILREIKNILNHELKIIIN